MQKIRLRGATKIVLSMTTGGLAGAALTGIAVHETTRRYPEVAASIGISIALIAFAILLAAAATLYHYVPQRKVEE